MVPPQPSQPCLSACGHPASVQAEEMPGGCLRGGVAGKGGVRGVMGGH